MTSRRWLRFMTVALAFAVALAAGTDAQATISGSLTSTNGGIVVKGGSWTTAPVTVAWEVTEVAPEDAPPPVGERVFGWLYEYTVSVEAAQGAISHLILEVSEGLKLADIAGVSGTPAPKNLEIGWYSTKGQKDGMPGIMWGLKLEPSSGAFTWIVSFYCTKEPVWGDFYLKDGDAGWVSGDDKVNRAWNLGYLDADPEPPLEPATSGSLRYHILRPDTIGGTTEPPVPEPLTVLGMFLGLGSLGAYIRKRRMA